MSGFNREASASGPEDTIFIRKPGYLRSRKPLATTASKPSDPNNDKVSLPTMVTKDLDVSRTHGGPSKQPLAQSKPSLKSGLLTEAVAVDDYDYDNHFMSITSQAPASNLTSASPAKLPAAQPKSRSTPFTSAIAAQKLRNQQTLAFGQYRASQEIAAEDHVVKKEQPLDIDRVFRVVQQQHIAQRQSISERRPVINSQPVPGTSAAFHDEFTGWRKPAADQQRDAPKKFTAGDRSTVDDHLTDIEPPIVPKQPIADNKPIERTYIPDGLPSSQHLTFSVPADGTAKVGLLVQGRDWEQKMLRLFRAHNVLDIMFDAVSEPGRKVRDARLKAGHRPILSGAKTATTAQLDVFDKSDDTTLLLRANHLIDASIDKTAARWVAGIDDPHQKWRVLMEMASTYQSEPGRDLGRYFSDILCDDPRNNGIARFVDTFMKRRGRVIELYGNVFTDDQFRIILIQRLSVPLHRVGVFRFILQWLLGQMPGEVNAMSLQRFALELVKRVEWAEKSQRGVPHQERDAAGMKRARATADAPAPAAKKVRIEA